MKKTKWHAVPGVQYWFKVNVDLLKPIVLKKCSVPIVKIAFHQEKQYILLQIKLYPLSKPKKVPLFEENTNNFFIYSLDRFANQPNGFYMICSDIWFVLYDFFYMTCSANQRDGFYLMWTLLVKGLLILIASLCHVTCSIISLSATLSSLFVFQWTYQFLFHILLDWLVFIYTNFC